MNQTLNFHDIQGNILRGYKFAAGIHYFVHLHDRDTGRALLRDLVPEVTRARPWTTPPVIAVNVALTFSGLQTLGVEQSILEALPDAFTEPIRTRAPRELGDDPEEWEAKLGTSDTHVVVMLASNEPPQDGAASLPGRFPRLACAGLWLMQRLRVHYARRVYRQYVETLPDEQREHFGFADGFGQPAVEGMSNNLPGQGTPQPETGAWNDIKAGEFILGYPNEDGETESGPAAWLLYDGSYMVYRKLEQDVPLFREVVSRQARAYAKAELDAGNVTTELSSRAGFELMAAKLVGRWRDARPLELFPGPDRDVDLRTQGGGRVDNDFRYGDDPNGYTCPLGAHVRRTNPRDLLGVHHPEARRHRIIRRGMPYGPAYDGWDGEGEATVAEKPDDAKRGLIFICFNADLERQFEVVQGQWCNDGNDFNLGAQQDFLLGSRQSGRMTIEGDPPFFAGREERMVITRGCEYLLMPGLAALERLSAPPAAVTSREVIPPEEPAATRAVVELVLNEMHRTYANARPMRRGQHPKPHAVLEAEFIVKDVPADLRHGLFARSGRYKAWIRYSSSHSPPRSDAKPDAQGMAIKVMGVDGQMLGFNGEKILPSERCRSTQDFVLVNHRVFFLRDAQEVAEFARVVTATVSLRDAKLHALEFFLRRGNLHGARTLQETIGTRPLNPLDLRYWSQTPYALGDDHAVKYSVRPKGPPLGAMGARRSDWNALENAINNALAPVDAEYWFELRVQRQADPVLMPIEDPRVRWSERDSPSRTVAMIRIAHQDFTTQERRDLGENLSFTPWHSLWAHRPLGGINRVRRAVYEASSDLRHALNGAPRSEPGGTIDVCPPRMPN
jgi:Dyp-type peroxidase family